MNNLENTDMALLQLTTKDWVDPATVRKVYQTFRRAPHVVHVLIVECDSGVNLQYEYK